jgi:hypothetical protein
MAGELPEDALEDIMIAEAMGNEGQNRNMPGGMPDQELIFADFMDEENEGDGDPDPPFGGHAPAQVQNVQNVGAVPGDAERNSDEGEEDSEEEEVVVSRSVHRASSAC